MNRAREVAIAVCDKFEELLDAKDITIPSADREGREEEARLYGSEYYQLEDTITDILAKVMRAERKMLRERLKRCS